ncbi:hypothetical protein PMAC_001757 [Pneumocystis sp. 'macacae']|nr:hypothetical protein PMAC_001757 [Pneumocystis sp. 'macacae']
MSFSSVSALLFRVKAAQAADFPDSLSSTASSTVAIDPARCTFIFDACIKDRTKNTKNTADYTSKETSNTSVGMAAALFIYVLDLSLDTSFSQVHQLLHVLYSSSEKSRASCSKGAPQIFIVFSNWCGYYLFDQPYMWADIYILSEDDEKLVPKSLKNRIRYISSCKLSDHVSVTESHVQWADWKVENEEKVKRYRKVAVGGTFDHLHAGHKVLLTMSAWISSERVMCGVSDEKMLETKKYKEWIEPIENRIENVQRFFNIINKRLLCSVKPIYDIYGATITDKDIEAIVVSEETRKGGEMVNEERLRRNMKALDLFCIKVIPDIEGSDLKLSSMSIREKMIKKD